MAVPPTSSVSNPALILQTLNKHLASTAEITLFGRAAIAFGYPQAPNRFHSTHDVDGILPMDWLRSSNAQEDFWRAIQLVNAELQSQGLYLTHLFREVDVIIQPDWIERRSEIHLGLSPLTVFRPATIDLILTKMARGDEEDLQDIGFLLHQEPISRDQLRAAFSKARVPNIPEIQELFVRAQPKVLDIADPF